MKEQVIYTDGACSGNPGPGGWGWVRLEGEGTNFPMVAQNCGGEKNTTNNRMELMAAIEGLRALSVKECVTIITDSKYVKQGMTEWIQNWKKKNWIGSNKQPVKNRDLWEELDRLCSEIKDLEWRWVKGHSGNTWNEVVDQLAVSAIPKE
jgi:ribonuclease HI